MTGATGLVGGQVLARELERSSRHVYLVVRADDDGAAAQRVKETLATFYASPDAYADRWTALAGDLQQPWLGVDRERMRAVAAEVGDVVHAAASVSFDLPLDRARQVNVEGTRHALEVAEEAERRGGLNRFCYVSTTYVAGMHNGSFGEEDLDVGQGFRNSYERSKFESERLVRDWSERLPVRILRPSIVVGERDSGWTPSFNVLYFPVKLFARGRTPPVIPARGETPIDVVPVDYVADAIHELSRRPGPSGETFNLVAGPHAATIREVLDRSAARFGRSVPPLMPLWLYMRTLHLVFSRSYRGDRKRQLRQAATYLPYFSMHQTFDDSAAREALEPAGLQVEPLGTYFDRLLDYATAADWGRQPLTREEARARFAS
jgi:long-chain acyl-CoA synthetase